jgi:hypothetical protein
VGELEHLTFFILLEGSQVSPACPPNDGSMKAKSLEWLEAVVLDGQWVFNFIIPWFLQQKCVKLLATCFDAGILLDLFFNPEYGGDLFLRNVCCFQRTTRRDSAVGIAPGYGLDDRGVGVRVPVG